MKNFILVIIRSKVCNSFISQRFLHYPKGTDLYFLCVRPILQSDCDLQKNLEISVLLYVPVRTRKNLTLKNSNEKKTHFPNTQLKSLLPTYYTLPSQMKDKVTESSGNSMPAERSTK